MVFMLVLLLNTEVPQASALGFVLLRTFVFLIICFIVLFPFLFFNLPIRLHHLATTPSPPVFNVIPFAGNTTSILSLLCNIPHMYHSPRPPAHFTYTSTDSTSHAVSLYGFCRQLLFPGFMLHMPMNARGHQLLSREHRDKSKQAPCHST